MSKNNNLYDNMKLNGKTIFENYISKNEDKLKIYNYGISNNLISEFDQTILTRLRKLYYGCYSAIIFLYYNKTSSQNISDKAELFTHVLDDKSYKVVVGKTDSTRNIPFLMNGEKYLDFDVWIEVRDGIKTYVYDLFSMLKFDKDIFYKLENPEIEKVTEKSYIVNHPGREIDYFTECHTDPFDSTIFMLIPRIEKELKDHPHKNILESELSRFKSDINYYKLYSARLEVLDNLRQTKRLCLERDTLKMLNY